MTDYGMKVSEPGIDATTATNDKDFTIKSDVTLLKVYDSATGESISGDKTISHGLGYIPQFISFVSDGTNAYFCTGNDAYGMARADSSNIYVKDTAGGSDASSVTYYIFYEQA